jgi:hypothetical protein
VRERSESFRERLCKDVREKDEEQMLGSEVKRQATEKKETRDAQEVNTGKKTRERGHSQGSMSSRMTMMLRVPHSTSPSEVLVVQVFPLEILLYPLFLQVQFPLFHLDRLSIVLAMSSDIS